MILLAVFLAFPAAADEAKPAVKDDKAKVVKAEAAPADDGAPAGEEEQLQAPAFAEPARSTFGGFRVYGDVLLNLQTVNVSGNEDRFRKDFGLSDGVYVGTSRLTFVPAGDQPAGWFDRLQVYADGQGFDSDKRNRYRTWGVSANKAGKYRFSIDSRANNYYWKWDGFLGEFDINRSLANVDLSITAVDNLEISAHYRPWSRTGDQLTAFDYSRDEFEFPTDYDQSGYTLGAGLRWRIGQTTLFVNQDFRHFSSSYLISDSDNQGLNPGGAYIDQITQTEDRSFDAPVTTGGFVTHFADRRFRLEGDILWSDQDFDSDYSRYWTGRSFSGAPTTDNTPGVGSGSRELFHGNARLFWRPTTAWGFTLQYRHRGYQQQGTALVGSTAPSVAGFADDITLDQLVVGVEFAPTRAFSVFGEFGSGKRKQALDHDYTGVEETEDGVHSDHALDDTDFLSYRFGVRARAGRSFDLETSYERNDVDNPFTRFAPTAIDAFKVKGRYRAGGKWILSGVYTYGKGANDTLERVDGAAATSKLRLSNLGFNASYMGGEGRYLYAGYQYLDNEIDMPLIFWNPTPRVQIDGDALYTGKNSVWTLGGEYLFSQDLGLTAYGNLNYVDSDTTESATPTAIWGNVAFPLVYSDMRVGLRYVFDMGVILDAQGRFMQYDDKSVLYEANTYDATMFVLGVGYRF